MKNLNEILDEWEKDCPFDDDLVKEGYRKPKLHNKYYKVYRKFKRQKSVIYENLKDLEFAKKLYYSGQASADTYKEKGAFNQTLKSSELEMYVRADNEVRELRLKYIKVIECVESLEEIIKQINTRDFTIKEINIALKFQAGGM